MLTLLEKPFRLPPLGTMPFTAVAAHYRDIRWEAAEKIHQPETNLVVIERAAPAFPATIAELNAHPKGEAQLAFYAGNDVNLIPALLDEELNLSAADSEAFYEDIKAVAVRFMKVARSPGIGIRLERINNDNCRLFHIDHVPLRLISTYFGPGTEWLPNEHVIRHGLGKGSDALVRKGDAPIERFGLGWIGILKGERYPGNRGRALVHRSPPLPGNGKPRVLLRIDAIS
ncbi:MAG: DUF1826 domain-containing protein [Proteobacteria bacterium]|nr:MAG: DUF1826 domain-containing protein [Pseudomonadota bacterium]